MGEENRNLLEEEIRNVTKYLKTLVPGSEEYAIVADNLVKLYKMKLEEDKNAVEREDKQAQKTEIVKDRRIKIAIAMLELFAPLGFYAVWMHKGFKFEETGSLTSSVFRGLTNRFRPTKK